MSVARYHRVTAWPDLPYRSVELVTLIRSSSS